MGTALENPARAGLTVVDGQGKYLIPGLIDAHVHLASVPGVDLDAPPTGEDVISKYYKQLPRSFLYFGYTTLIDLAVVYPQVLADFRQQPVHPDLYDCGPSLQVMGGTQALADPEFLNDSNLAKVIPKELLNFYRMSEGKWFKNLIEEDEDLTLTMQTHEPSLSRVGRVTKYLAQRGARLIFGTDTPSAPTYGNPPGYNGFLEMKRWVDNGVSLEQLLFSATLGTAHAFKLDESIGTVEEGKVANLLLLSKNPLEDLQAYDSIDVVFIHGKALNRSDLAMQGTVQGE